MDLSYGIIAHKNSKVLKNTINLLSRDNKLFLHIDKKVSLDNFKEYKGKVNIIKDNVAVEWGMFSQIECILKILEEAVKSKFDYLCILSGDDMPLKNNEAIKSFFYENRDKEFIGIDNKISSSSLKVRVKYKYKGYHYKKDKSLIEKIASNLQKKLSLIDKNDKFDKLPTLYKGPNWFCISYDFCNYILNYLNENQWYKEAFKESLCADEVFFQTLIMNSKFKERIYKYNEVDDNHMALRYIDWKTGPEYPRILNEEDFERIKQPENKDCIFARKFNENIDIDRFNKEFNLK